MLGALLREAAFKAADEAFRQGKVCVAHQKLWYVRCVATKPRPCEPDIFGVVHFAANGIEAHQLALEASHSY